jgi:hypothetical protein
MQQFTYLRALKYQQAREDHLKQNNYFISFSVNTVQSLRYFGVALIRHENLGPTAYNVTQSPLFLDVEHYLNYFLSHSFNYAFP